MKRGPKARMIRGAIFDIDGTLLDSMPAWEDAGARYLRSIGIEPEPNLRQLLFPMSVEEGAAYLKKHYDLPQSEDEIGQGVLDIVENCYRFEVPLKPGAEVLLRRLREADIPIVAATSGNETLDRAALTRLRVAEHFSAILTCGQLNTSKRKPIIYQCAAKLLGAAPEEIMVFEDALYAARTAKQAGFFVAGVYDAASDGDGAALRELCDWYLSRLDDTKFWNEITGQNT